MWVDELLDRLKNSPPKGVDISGKIEALEYAKEVLNEQNELPRQNNINRRFYGLVRDIVEYEEKWGDIGVAFSDISEYISGKKSAENQF